MGRKILFVTTDQQRYDTLRLQRRRQLGSHPGGRRPRRRGRPLRAGRAPVGRVHAVALDDAHRPAPEHPRRVDERRRPPADAPSVAAELHRAGYRTALVGKPHFEPFLDPFGRFAENRLGDADGHTDRRPWPTAPPARTAASTTWSSPPTRPMGELHYARWMQPRAPRGARRLLPRARRRPRGQRRRRRRHRRPAGEGQPGRPGLVPHRLGRRSDDRLARRPRRRRRLVRLDELPRPPPPVGPAGVGGGPGRLARRPAAGRLPDVAGRARADPRRQAPPLAALVRRHAGVELRGADLAGCRPRSPTTRCARSTP